MGLTTLTWIHVALSVIGLAAGFVVVAALLQSKQHGWTFVFLASTVLTSATGFLFPFHRFLPSHGVGIISLVVLAVAILALYGLRLTGIWRWVYAATAVLSLYFNFFVLVAQAFAKVPALQALAPTQSEAPFAIAQGIVLVAFVAVTVAAARKFHPATA
jgi:hypothetical protein